VLEGCWLVITVSIVIVAIESRHVIVEWHYERQTNTASQVGPCCGQRRWVVNERCVCGVIGIDLAMCDIKEAERVCGVGDGGHLVVPAGETGHHEVIQATATPMSHVRYLRCNHENAHDG
jgi:hypothetical protein